MIFGMTFYQICCFFLIYSFIGWIVEVAFHAVTLGKVVNRGFLNGPVCPVYGFGMLAVLSISYFIPANEAGQINTLLLFLTGTVFTTLVELIAGWILDKAFHARWWDYSSMPLNLHGYICLAFSIIWGLAVVLAVKLFHPLVAHFSLAALPPKIGWILIGILYAILIVDFIVTIAMVRGLNNELKQLDELQGALRKSSDKMSEYIAENTLKVTASVEKARVQATLGKAEMKDSIEEKKRIHEQRIEDFLSKQKWGSRRLLRAFPKMKHHDYPQTLAELREAAKKKRSK